MFIADCISQKTIQNEILEKGFPALLLWHNIHTIILNLLHL